MIVENVFGRQGGLWSILSINYTWSESLYGSIFATYVALTNFHVRRNPLRRDDEDIQLVLRTRLYYIGNEVTLSVSEGSNVIERGGSSV